MQMLLTILIATAASQVQTAGFVCSKFPVVSKMYDLAQKLSGWKTSVEPKSRAEKSFQEEIKTVILFKKEYELEGDAGNCEFLVCNQWGLLWHRGSLPPEWSNIRPDYRVVLEDYVDLVGRGFYNLSSSYCQAAGPKLKQLAELAKSLDKILRPNYSKLGNLEGDIHMFLRELRSVDGIQCRYLTLPFLDCSYFNRDRDGLKSITEEVRKQVQYLNERCEKTKLELKPMTGDRVDC